MTRRSHLLDVYGAWLHVATNPAGWSALQRRHKGLTLNDPNATGSVELVTHVTPSGRHTVHLFVYISTAEAVGPRDLADTCAHEATHVAGLLFDHIGQSMEHGETLAYLVGWVTGWLWDAVSAA